MRVSAGRILRASAALLGLVSVGLALPAGAQTSGSGDDSSRPGTVGHDPDGAEDSNDEKPLRAKVEQLLSGYHFEPDREALDGLASEADVAETLRTIARDVSARPSMRSRAVNVLALYPSDRTESVLEAFLGPPGDDLSDKQRRAHEVVRLHAITSIAEVRDGDEAVTALEGMLDADDLQVRLMTVTALGKYAGEPGERRLRELAKNVEESEVRREIDKYIPLD